MNFLACRVYQQEKTVSHRLEQISLDALKPGGTVIKVHYSGVNYKDALAATGRGAILKEFPLNAGIDLAGEVVSSENANLKVGQQVLVNGCGLGEMHDGGLAQYARVPSEWVIPLPQGLTLQESMVLGTAGFTAALAIHRMELNGQTPENGPIVVTGASGGVGSIAVDMLSSIGYQVIALSGRREFDDYLTQLGASKVCAAEDLQLGTRPLEKGQFGGVIDNVGGELLSQLIAHTNLWGNVACIGLANSHMLKTTVFPLILRGVSLLGVSSTNCPMTLRENIWQKMGNQLKPQNLNLIQTDVVPLTKVSAVFEALLDRKLHGRVVIDCQQ